MHSTVGVGRTLALHATDQSSIPKMVPQVLPGVIDSSPPNSPEVICVHSTWNKF